jgi:hypothetical protein
LGGEIFLDNGEGKIDRPEIDTYIERNEAPKITTKEQSENEHMLNRPSQMGETN